MRRDKASTSESTEAISFDTASSFYGPKGRIRWSTRMPNSRRLKGFLINSSAPSPKLPTIASSLPFAVKIKTGTSLFNGSFLRACKTSNP